MTSALPIYTDRLCLIEITPEFLRADQLGPSDLAAATGCIVPPAWPPEHWESNGIEYLLEHMTRYPSHAGWVRFISLRSPAHTGIRPVLMGMCGTTMPILQETQTVEIGYSLLEEFQGRGYATEAVRALVGWIFSHAQVSYIEAQTFPALLKSIRVLEKVGFAPGGSGTEPGALLFRLARSSA